MVKNEEVYLQCQVCKQTETAEIKKGKLIANYKYVQIGDTIYHLKICGKVRIIK